MSYVEKTFLILHAEDYHLKALAWSSQYSHATLFNNCNVPFPYHGFSNILFVGAYQIFKYTPGQIFEDLYRFYSHNNSWLTGYFSYDLKNEIENLQTNKTDLLHFENLYFYEPEFLIFFDNTSIKILSKSVAPEIIFAQIENTPIPSCNDLSITLNSKIDQGTYLSIIEEIKEHIAKGDVYELNFCLEFFKKGAIINPIEVYLKLIQKSPSPFSVFQKINDKFLLGSSPERFLKKEGNKLISQPIKGTSPRFLDEADDIASKLNLLSSEKERAENLMIVDLVRNDLARSAQPGTIKVEELFGIYSFAQVHQMISTITAELSQENNFIEAIKNAFPMGSMTGAPKIRAMELIEHYEQSKRGLYSGSIGYISPHGDFDFNVVIRSLIYNSSTQYLSLQTGSAITFDSIPEQEYKECFLKAQALMDVLASR